MRRTHLRGHENILKRVLVHTAAFNLGLLMRTLFGVGKPRCTQGRLAALWAALVTLIHAVATVWRTPASGDKVFGLRGLVTAGDRPATAPS